MVPLKVIFNTEPVQVVVFEYNAALGLWVRRAELLPTMRCKPSPRVSEHNYCAPNVHRQHFHMACGDSHVRGIAISQVE